MGVSVVLVSGSAIIGTAALQKEKVNKGLPSEVSIGWVTENYKMIYHDEKNGQTKYFHVGVFDHLVIWGGEDKNQLWLSACGKDKDKCEKNKNLHPVFAYEKEDYWKQKSEKNKAKAFYDKLKSISKNSGKEPSVIEWADLFTFNDFPSDFVIEFLPKTPRALNTIWFPKTFLED